jgi:hypothetical protein
MQSRKRSAKFRCIGTLNEKDEEIANVLSPIAWLASELYAIEEKGKEIAHVLSPIA